MGTQTNSNSEWKWMALGWLVIIGIAWLIWHFNGAKAKNDDFPEPPMKATTKPSRPEEYGRYDEFVPDGQGGVYVKTSFSWENKFGEGLWYLRDGKATRIRVVSDLPEPTTQRSTRLDPVTYQKVQQLKKALQELSEQMNPD